MLPWHAIPHVVCMSAFVRLYGLPAPLPHPPLPHPLCPAPRYEMEMKEKQSQAEGEDMSDMVAEHVAKQKVRTTIHMHEDLNTSYEAVLSAAGKGFHG